MVKHTQTIRRQQPTSCLSVFDHFVKLVLKGLSNFQSTIILQEAIIKKQLKVIFVTSQEKRRIVVSFRFTCFLGDIIKFLNPNILRILLLTRANPEDFHNTFCIYCI